MQIWSGSSELVRNLIRHHERVQAGKLDASRQPKRRWVELRGNEAVIDSRYAPDERPEKPDAIRRCASGSSSASASIRCSRVPNPQSSGLRAVLSFGTAWRNVTRRPEEFVVEPPEYDGDDEGGWPAFIRSLRAKRDELIIEGNAATWPHEVVIRMKDIRSRLLNEERWFDPWTVRAPADAEGVFSTSTPLSASWLDRSPVCDRQAWPALPDLEAEVSWDGGDAILPVVFEDKHRFPVVESRSREDEQSLVAWFLGLRPAGEMEKGGFGHSIDPVPSDGEPPPATGDILSYLVRDFVHALPGIRNRLADAGMTETGLRAALLGFRSPVERAA